ncbi:MAG: ABC transporter permease [Actinobacteria bacterium]|nr:ABC transporter permease [Actinomycetota bacterium]
MKDIKPNLGKSFVGGWSSVVRYPAFGAIVAFTLLFGFFSIIAPDFLSLTTLTGILSLVAEIGIIAIGEAFLIISGEFDLSVGGVYAIAGFLFVVLANLMPSILALIITLTFCGLIGFINGVITMKVTIPSFITTLGMLMLTRGSLLGFTRGSSVTYSSDKFVPMILSNDLGYGIRPSHIWLIVLTVIFTIILTNTRYGNWTFSSGGNANVARTLGIEVERVKIKNFMISSAMAGFAGIIAMSRFKFANASFGTGYELEAITAAVIGGVYLFGGYGTVIGAVLGAGMMAIIRFGLVLVGVPGYSYQAFIGGVLIIAAIINLRIRRIFS